MKLFKYQTDGYGQHMQHGKIEKVEIEKESVLKANYGNEKHRVTYQMLKHHGLWPTIMGLEKLMGWPIGASALRPLETDRCLNVWLRHGIF